LNQKEITEVRNQLAQYGYWSVNLFKHSTNI
jgi:hypothetical protein